MNIIDISDPGRCRFVECREPIFWRKVHGSPEPFDPPEMCPDCVGSGRGDALNTEAICTTCEGKGRIQRRHIPTCLGMKVRA